MIRLGLIGAVANEEEAIIGVSIEVVGDELGAGDERVPWLANGGEPDQSLGG